MSIKLVEAVLLTAVIVCRTLNVSAISIFTKSDIKSRVGEFLGTVISEGYPSVLGGTDSREVAWIIVFTFFNYTI